MTFRVELDQWSDAQNTASPLILDLDGDNVVETISKSAGLHFDHSADSFAEATGWVGKDDGLLVRDLNGNGTIDTGRELFGNQTLRTDGTLAANGFEALADLDSNNDGKISSADTQWNTLRVWKDADGDAVTDAGELLTLSRKTMDVYGKRVPLSPGMNITAEIKTGQRRGIEFLLSPVQRAGSESLRERWRRSIRLRHQF